MTTSRNARDIRDKVQKLLTHAADREGTPEAESFYAKAFDLMARHGIDQRDLSAGAHRPGMRQYTVEFAGKYREMQMNLLSRIADGLHCATVGTRRPRAVGIESGTVFGVDLHVERVELLFTLLNPMMAALSVDAVPAVPAGTAGRTRDPARSAVAQRRSFMQGFAAEIYRRLHEAESRAGESHTGYGLALIDDTARAHDFLREEMEHQGTHLANHRRRGKFDPSAFHQGAAAARDADLGQRRVPGGRALPSAG